MGSTEPEGALKELETLQSYHVVYEGDQVKAFVEWARVHADRLYPELGEHGYMVPPLFVHKHSTRYDQAAGADVLQEYQKSSPKGEKAHSYVARSFYLLSPRLKAPLFIISGLEYDNLLKWVRHHPHLSPHLPDAVENRGDIDIMLIHPHHGVVFIQVKAVGDNALSRTQTEIQKKIGLGGKQLRKDDNILRWVLQDWPEASNCHVTHVVALPNLTRHELASFWPPPDLDLQSEDAIYTEGVVFLCKDDLPAPQAPSTPEADVDVTSLMTWWQCHVGGVREGLSLPFMKDIVSRYVGMLSAVEVYAGNNLRREVRLTSDAIDVCGMMFRRILLNEHQLRILSTPCQRRYLSGPPGSGKTVLLVLRARQFLRQGGHVIVVNMYRGAAGRAIGHFIRDSVSRFLLPHGYEGKKGKTKPKAKKKKEEEHARGQTAADDTAPSASTSSSSPCRCPLKAPHLKTPPSPLKQPSPGPSTPPKLRRGGKKTTDNLATPTTTPTTTPISSPTTARSPVARKLQDSPQACGKAPGTPSCAGRKKDSSHQSSPGTPPAVKKTGGSREAHGTPPPSRKRGQGTEVDMSDRVHSVDIDIDHSSFDPRDFDRQIRHWLPADVRPENVMFVVDEIYVKEYWSQVLEVLDEGFRGCTIWCAGLYSRNPPSFEQEDLLHVLRCPPLVQKVLHAVDWDPERRKRYHLEPDFSSGIYTQGMTPLTVRHQKHPQVTITECPHCAQDLASLLRQLGLTLTPPTTTTTSCPTSLLAGSAPAPIHGGSPSPLALEASSPEPFSNLVSPSSSSDGGSPRQLCDSSHESSEPGHTGVPSQVTGQPSCSGCPNQPCSGVPNQPCLGGPSQLSSSRMAPNPRAPGIWRDSGEGRPGSEGYGGRGTITAISQTTTATITTTSATTTAAVAPSPAPLSCSDVVVLVNIPRELYEPDERGFLDTTKQDFDAYMAYLASCPLVTSLQRSGVPLRVVQELPCWDLHQLREGQVSVAWAYTYQGLENKLVVYLPGDTPWTPPDPTRPPGPEIPAPGLCSTPRLVPKVWQPTTTQHLLPTSISTAEAAGGDVIGDVQGHGDVIGDVESVGDVIGDRQGDGGGNDVAGDARGLSSSPRRGNRLGDGGRGNVDSGSSGGGAGQSQSGRDDAMEILSSSTERVCGGSSIGEEESSELPAPQKQQTSSLHVNPPALSPTVPERAGTASQQLGTDPQPNKGGGVIAAGKASPAPTEAAGQGSVSSEGGCSLSLAQYWWKQEDIERYSNWDKSNLFVAGSRCLSQLIMLIP